MPRRFTGLFVLIFVVAAGRVALAFNELGHSAVGKVAFDGLTPAQRTAVHAVLVEHPHYGEYLAAGKPSGVDLEEWVFLRAGTWSDWVRSNHRDEYHQSTWHYVNYPYRMGGPTALPAAPIPQRTNILERLPLAVAMVAGDGSTDLLGLPPALSPKARRAVALTWLFHLVGDLHQPLHVVAMIDDARWPGGDQGGNLEAVVVNGTTPIKLHAYWDGALRRPMNYAEVATVVAELASRPPFDDERWTAAAAESDILKWAAESYALAAKYAYLDGKLPLAPWRPAYDLERAAAGSDVPVLDDAAKDAARRIYRQRLLLGGRRLANQLNTLFP
jgi:hypothetical protein